MSIIHNMNVLSKCKDAQDKVNLDHRMARHPVQPLDDRPPLPNPFDMFKTSRQDNLISPDSEANAEDNVHEATLLHELDRNLGTQFYNVIDVCFSHTHQSAAVSSPGRALMLLTEEMHVGLDMDHATMRTLKRKWRPDDNDSQPLDSDRNVQPRLDQPLIVDSMRLGAGSSTSIPMGQNMPADEPEDVVYQVVLEKNLRSNPEQLRAFEIVSNHVINGGPQLTMYVSGVGGTSKSHIVNSILHLFSLLGKCKNILVAAPTGAATILIGGYTIHSLTLLPNSPHHNVQELSKIWEGVDYLILNKISMIGARFLSQLNTWMLQAKGYNENCADLLFGGVNIIFMGDFGQLQPVQDPPLYSHSLVQNPGLRTVLAKPSISTLKGICLWRNVNKVVLLKINQRQAQDKLYTDILHRIHIGEAKNTCTDGSISDFAALRTHHADQINTDDPSSLSKFRDSPIIVGRKKLHDLLNLCIMGHYANQYSATIHLYHAKDKITSHSVSSNKSNHLWQLSLTIMHDSLGKLPLLPSMAVMVQENLAFSNCIINGTQGTMKDIVYEEEDRKHYPVVMYVHIPGSGTICTNVRDNIVPIFPKCTTFIWSRIIDGNATQVSVSRLQLLLLLAYAYTDYKSQGCSLNTMIVDPASATMLQGIYVMLSRVRAITSLAILRPFKAGKIEQHLSQELQMELQHLDNLDVQTCINFHSMFRPIP